MHLSILGHSAAPSICDCLSLSLRRLWPKGEQGEKCEGLSSLACRTFHGVGGLGGRSAGEKRTLPVRTLPHCHAALDEESQLKFHAHSPYSATRVLFKKVFKYFSIF